MICSNLLKVWLFLSSSQAAVIETTSGFMLFNCSSNCSLNRMAWSRGISRFTLDIWREKTGRGIWDPFLYLLPHRLCVSVCAQWDGTALHPLDFHGWTKQSVFHSLKTVCAHYIDNRVLICHCTDFWFCVCRSLPLLQTVLTQPSHHIHPSSLLRQSAALVLEAVW